MSTLIRTDQVPAADRLDFIREMTATTWVPMECRLSTAALEVLATRLAHELDVRDWGTPEARRHALLTTDSSGSSSTALPVAEPGGWCRGFGPSERRVPHQPG
jgi:hypothetical protein